MTKDDARRIAEEFVRQHKDRHKAVAKKDIKQAVERVAKALKGFNHSTSIEEPRKKVRARAA